MNLRTTQASVSPDVIDLGLGQPDLAILPLALLRRAASHRLEQEDTSFLQYGLEQGDSFFRLALARFLNQSSHGPAQAEELFVTSGVSQALALICTLFTRPGDTIIVEEPTYFLALQIFSDHRLNLVSVPTDAHGMDIEALEDRLRRHRPAFIYTIPTYQNPTSVTLSLERRQRLVELSQRHGVLIVADEVYHLLSYQGTPPPALGSFAERGGVLSLGSFSKILAPGLRLGWVQAAQPLVERLAGSGLVQSGGGLNPVASALVRSALEQGWQREYLEKLKAIYRQRSIALSQALQEHMAHTATYRMPRGGFFFWIALPAEIDAGQLLEQAQRDHQVSFQPGVKFSAAGALHNYLRLSFTYYDEAALQEGIERLARALQSYRP